MFLFWQQCGIRGLLLLETVFIFFIPIANPIFNHHFPLQTCDGGEWGREISFKELGLQKLRALSVVPTGDELIVKLSTLDHSTIGSVCVINWNPYITTRQYKSLHPLNNVLCLQGINYLVENKLMDGGAQSIAEFLYKEEGLNKTAIGEFLGERWGRDGEGMIGVTVTEEEDKDGR